MSIGFLRWWQGQVGLIGLCVGIIQCMRENDYERNIAMSLIVR
jgi:hypothetical protein